MDPGRYGCNRVDTVLIPYGPGSKSGCVWLYHKSPPIRLIFTRIKSGSWLWMSCGMRQGSMQFYAADWCGSNWFNTDINTELKSLQNFLNMTQNVFSPYRSCRILRNWHGLQCRSMRVKLGRYSFDTVWTRFEIRLCVTVALPICLFDMQELARHTISFWFQAVYWQTSWCYRGFNCLVYRQLSANYMVVTTILFVNTTFLWATCCLICFIQIVQPFLTHWSWLRFVLFI
jgi:hypothetical protein